MNKKVITLITSIGLISAIGATTVFAATNETGATFDFKDRPALTEEKKADMQAKQKGQQDKMASLTDAQKAEIYALQQKDADNKVAIIDKYLELGLIDETTATKMKAKIADRLNRMKENGGVPMLGRGGNFSEKKDKVALTEEQIAQRKANIAENLKQAVASGEMTQEEADEILAICETAPAQGRKDQMKRQGYFGESASKAEMCTAAIAE